MTKEKVAWDDLLLLGERRNQDEALMGKISGLRKDLRHCTMSSP
jgi:hypothetical protein